MWEGAKCARVCEMQTPSGGVGEHLALRARPATPAASAVLAGLAREIAGRTEGPSPTRWGARRDRGPVPCGSHLSGDALRR